MEDDFDDTEKVHSTAMDESRSAAMSLVDPEDKLVQAVKMGREDVGEFGILSIDAPFDLAVLAPDSQLGKMEA